MKLQTKLNDQDRRIKKLEDEAVLKDTVIDELQHQMSAVENQNHVSFTQSEKEKDRFNNVNTDRYNEHDRNKTLSIGVVKPVRSIYEGKTNRQSKILLQFTQFK